MIGTEQLLNHDAFICQIFAPNFRNQFGVMLTLNPNTRRAGHAGFVCNVQRTRRGEGFAGNGANVVATPRNQFRNRRFQIHRHAFVPEALPQLERTAPMVPILQLHLPLPTHFAYANHFAYVTRRDVLQHHAHFNRKWTCGLAGVHTRRQNIGTITIETHASQHKREHAACGCRHACVREIGTTIVIFMKLFIFYVK
ncbi:Uncharacterised protein [Arcanobacterium haemolyticum]|nr:Uncharacterised protein [Arcanobacterium haemolyticum]